MSWKKITSNQFGAKLFLFSQLEFWNNYLANRVHIENTLYNYFHQHYCQIIVLIFFFKRIIELTGLWKLQYDNIGTINIQGIKLNCQLNEEPNK